MTGISAEHLGGDRFAVRIRGHRLIVDQPGTGQDEDTEPTATEVFVAGLAACFAGNARRYLASFGQLTEGLRVCAEYRLSKDWPVRVTAIDLTLTVPALIPATLAQALREVATHCPVYATMTNVPAIGVRVVCATIASDARVAQTDDR
jgi:uncharacterized OsmC-like protein